MKNEKALRILLLTTHLDIGGVASYTLNLASGLKRRGIPVWVASGGGELVKTLEGKGIPHLTVGVKTKFEFHPKLLPVFFRLRNLIKEKEINVIHAQTRVTQVLASLLSRSGDVAYVSTCHGFFKKTRVARRVFGAWGKFVIAISDAVQDHLVKDLRVKKDNVFLIYNGVDLGLFEAGTNGNADEGTALKSNLGFRKSPVIGSVSRLSPVKGLRYLLFAMKDLLKEIPDAKLLLVGEGPSRDFLMGLARKLNIEGNVFFAHGTTQIRKFLSIMDIFVFYSLEEGLGLSLLEALASGKPCVASDVGGISSVVKDGVTGILVPPKDAHLLKEAMLKLLRDKGYSAQLAEKGRKLVRDRFSVDTMLEGVLKIYDKTRKD